jgi:hypothetical protein
VSGMPLRRASLPCDQPTLYELAACSCACFTSSGKSCKQIRRLQASKLLDSHCFQKARALHRATTY